MIASLSNYIPFLLQSVLGREKSFNLLCNVGLKQYEKIDVKWKNVQCESSELDRDFAAEEIIKTLKPDIYFKGPDYKDHLRDITGKINDEEASVKSIGGEILYTEDITFSSSSLLNKYGDLYSQDQEAFITNITKTFYK